jgi:hypothetical protein
MTQDAEYTNYQPDYSKTGTVVAMCMALFKVSAQCNKNINGYGNDGYDVSILTSSFWREKTATL